MGRNLYILAGTLAFLALISVALSFTNLTHEAGSPGDASLWRTSGIVLFCISLIVALAGILSALFEQAERRDSESRRQRRRR